jgi:hypothetical protein
MRWCAAKSVTTTPLCLTKLHVMIPCKNVLLFVTVECFMGNKQLAFDI